MVLETDKNHGSFSGTMVKWDFQEVYEVAVIVFLWSSEVPRWKLWGSCIRGHVFCNPMVMFYVSFYFICKVVPSGYISFLACSCFNFKCHHCLLESEVSPVPLTIYSLLSLITSSPSNCLISPVCFYLILIFKHSLCHLRMRRIWIFSVPTFCTLMVYPSISGIKMNTCDWKEKIIILECAFHKHLSKYANEDEPDR